jgi:hypothetical protein
VLNGERRYILRNAPFEPQRVSDLKNLLNLSTHFPKSNASNEKKKKLNGVEVLCIQTKSRDTGTNWGDVCIDPRNMHVVSEISKGIGDVTLMKEFSDYIPLAGHEFPTTFKTKENDRMVMDAHITSLHTSAFDDALLTPPPGAIERRECEGIIPPLIRNQSRDHVPSLDGPGGITSLLITVGTDGSVAEAHVIGRSTPEMDEKILKSLSGWKFSPAMCGEEPVVADVTVAIQIQKF